MLDYTATGGRGLAFRSTRMALLSSAMFAGCWSAAAAAQVANPPQTTSSTADNAIQDIVVTAQRRSESIQKVPVAITAIGGDALERQGINSSTALEGVVPNLTMSKTGATTHPYLRGVGSDTTAPLDESSVATYVDGFYIASPMGNQYELSNLERIEVLKGPQGTLFGRNATGGVIQLITKDPKQDFAYNGMVGYGNYDYFETNQYVTGGIADGLAADLAVRYDNQGEGYGVNLYNGRPVGYGRNLTVRSKWLYEAGDDRITIAGGYSRIRTTGLTFQVAPGTTGVDGSAYPGRFNIRTPVEPFQKTDRWDISARWQHDFDFASFISSTYYGSTKNQFQFDSDATPFPGVTALAGAVPPTKQYTQEFQLQAPAGSPVQWQGGLYLFRLDGTNNVYLTGAVAGGADYLRIVGKGRTDSIAGYAQASYEFLPRLKATGGIRYTYDYNDMKTAIIIGTTPVFVLQGDKRHQSTSKPTWRLALDYQATDNLLGYASYNRGTKSGGYTSNVLVGGGYQPEILDAYEIGVKSDFFSHRLRFNIAAFLYEYKNLQVAVINATGTSADTINAASARMKGIDIDFTAVPIRDFTITGGIGLLDAKFTDYVGASFYAPDGVQTTGTCLPGAPCATGNRTPNAAKFTGSVTANYRIATSIGDININGSVVRKSKSYSAADNRLPYPAYTLVNGTIGLTLPGDKLTVELWGKNLTDQVYYSAATESQNGYIVVGASPRTYGVRLRVAM